MSKNIMFDTNIFDKILDEEISLDLIEKGTEKGFCYFLTHIQRDEIEAIEKPEKLERKKKLLGLLGEFKEEVSTESFVLGTSRLGKAKLTKTATESAVWGVSRWGESKWTDEKTTLIDHLRKGNLKHTEDALIGETAIKNGFILVSHDDRLRNLVKELGGTALSIEDFKELLK